MKKHFYAVIMAGGGGTRLWPASHRGRPKQLMSLGGGNKSLLKQAVDRAAAVVGMDHILVVTAASQAEAVAEELEELEDKQILAEPVGRNTAPCIGLAAEILYRQDPSAVMAVLPADHHIEDVSGFSKVASKALEQAASGVIVTLGIRPHRPETGYGYIEAGDPVEGVQGVHWSKGFVEKPDLETANRYMETGRFFWNSGMFFMKAEEILAQMAKVMPSLRGSLEVLGEASTKGPEQLKEALQEVYPGLDAISIDYGVMERVDRMQVVPADFGWNDVGSWSALEEILDADDNSNIQEGRALFVDSKDCISFSDDGRVVALLGVSGLAVISSEKGVLVCPKERAQEVRRVVAALEE